MSHIPERALTPDNIKIDGALRTNNVEDRKELLSNSGSDTSPTHSTKRGLENRSSSQNEN